MEAHKLYTKLLSLVFKTAANLSKRRVQQISINIIELRQLLSCVVCCELLKDPFEPIDRHCGHNVCRLCLRGRKRLSYRCDQCGDGCDYKSHEENKSMALQLLCYKRLCVHLYQSSLYPQLLPYPQYGGGDHLPRIKLPPMTTHWFIQEGMNYIYDMCDKFFPQHELPFFYSSNKQQPSPSLPSETPPYMGATTPELPFEQHTPIGAALSLSDIELEAAATGDEVQFASPLPLMSPTAANMLHQHNHNLPGIATQSQSHSQMFLPAGYIDDRWTDQVHLSEALTLPASYAYVLPSSNEVQLQQLPVIGQVVQMSTQTEAPTSYKRRHAELLLDELQEEQLAEMLQKQQQPVAMELLLNDVEQQAQAELEEESQELEQQTELEQAELGRKLEQKLKLQTELEQATKPERDQAEQSELEQAVKLDGDQAEPSEIEQEQAELEQKPDNIQRVNRRKKQQQHNHQQLEQNEEQPLRRVSRRQLRNQKPKLSSSVQPKAQVSLPDVALAASSAAPAAGSTPASCTPLMKKEAITAKPKSATGALAANCRCGTTSVPGRCTCRNSRCPCYMAGRSCKLSGCKCHGCKNPHLHIPRISSSSEEDAKLLVATDTVKEEVKPEQPKSTDAAEAVAATGAATVTATGAGTPPPNFTLVPAAQQTQHPLVYMMNETGEYQGFNIFNGNAQLDPAQLGFPRIPCPSKDGKKPTSEFMYIVPPAPESERAPTPPAASTGVKISEQPAKKLENGSFIRDIVNVVNENAKDSTDLLCDDESEMPA